jgi:hypothetical protein
MKYHCIAYLHEIDLSNFPIDFFKLDPDNQFSIVQKYYLPKDNPESAEIDYTKPWGSLEVNETHFDAHGGRYTLATNAEFRFVCLLWNKESDHENS